MPNMRTDDLPVPSRTARELGRPVHWLLGLPFDAVTLDEAVSRIAQAVGERTPLFLSTPNLNFLMASQRDPAFQRSVLNSDLSVADGMPIVWIARLLGIPLPGRVAGSDIFEALMRGECGPIKLYLFGGEAGVAERAAARINEAGGAMRCVGHHCPGFGSIEDMSTPEVIEQINACEPDFVLVALGAGKGQAWIEHNRARLSAPVISHLGAVINFAAGTVSRAPAWMQKTGLEWLWRIKEEPKLVRRYLSDGLALLRTGVGNVLPLVWANLWRRRSRKRPCSILVRQSAGQMTVELSGSWSRAAREGLVRALESAARQGSPCRIRIGQLDNVDASLLGLIYLTRRGGGALRAEVLDTPGRQGWYRLNKAEALVDLA
jgi:N-acetylglucosaminyldiphosphoundecaprenol N-acetyl-beta-D-mannosaminyltransferase